MDMRKLILELEEVGMSQADIAREIGVSQGRVNQVRNAENIEVGFRGAATVKLLALHAVKLPQAAA